MKTSRPRTAAPFGGWALAGLWALGLLTGCQEEKRVEPTSWDLTAAPFLDQWKEAAMTRSGGFVRESDGLTLKAGQPMSGVVFPKWVEQGLPVTDYTFTYEAMRVSGGDFFGSVTFPVGSVERCVTFVLGGWGGSQVGISCIDGYDASENSTGSSQTFENGRWYKVRIEVRTDTLKVWIDGRPIVSVNTAGAQLSLRGGEIHHCVPFGFATYGTEGRVKGVVVQRMRDEGGRGGFHAEARRARRFFWVWLGVALLSCENYNDIVKLMRYSQNSALPN